MTTLERIKVLRVAGAALLLCALGAPGVAAQANTCLRATLDTAFVLPDGSTHAAGTIRVCLERKLSPGVGLHTISAGGFPVGMFRSRNGETEETPGDAFGWLVFARVPGRPLVFLGYSMRWRDRMLLYWLDAPGGKAIDTLPPALALDEWADVLLVPADAA